MSNIYVESAKLVIDNAVLEMTSKDNIWTLKQKIENINNTVKKISNIIKDELENDGFAIPQNFEKNPLWYIYFKIINFMKQKWIILKNINWWNMKYTNIKYDDIYNTWSINIWSLHWEIANNDFENLTSMIGKFKKIYKFNKAKSEIREKIEKYKQYEEKSEFYTTHETVVIANKQERNKRLVNTLSWLAVKLEDIFFPTNFSKMTKVQQKYEKIKQEKVEAHKEIWINYIEINNNQIIWLQNDIKSRQNSPLLKKYQQQLQIKNQISQEKTNYIKNIKILKLKLTETMIKIEDLEKEIKRIEIEIQKYEAKINELNERINQIENELSKSAWSLGEIKKLDISKLKAIANSLIREKEEIQKEKIPRLQTTISNLNKDKTKVSNQKEELAKEQHNNLSEQSQLKQAQNDSIKRNINVKTSMAQAKLDKDIIHWVYHLQELFKYDNVCIKFEEDNYNIYIDTSKKNHKDWTMYPMLYNHHKPVVIASFSKNEFEALFSLYPKFKTQINKEINKNAKNAFLSDRINNKNTIDLSESAIQLN